MIDLDAIEVIDAIVSSGSYASAAEKLHKVRSALTYTVKKMEDDLGVSIFDRTGHRATLTPIGKEVLKHGRILLQQSRHLHERIGALKGGWEEKLHVSYNDLIPIEHLLPLVDEFHAACPYTQLTLTADRLNGTIECITLSDADLSIGISRDVPDLAEFESFEMPSLEFVFAISPNHPLASVQEPIPNDEILKHISVSATDTALQMASRTAGILSGQKLFRVNSIHAKKQAQIAGIGVGYLPKVFIKDELADGLLIVKQVSQPKINLPMAVAWRSSANGKALSWLIGRLRQESFHYLTGE